MKDNALNAIAFIVKHKLRVANILTGYFPVWSNRLQENIALERKLVQPLADLNFRPYEVRNNVGRYM